MNLNSASWLHAPAKFSVSEQTVKLTTEPNTDLWQGTYYGFRVANAPALLWEDAGNFTFSVKASFQYRQQFDQCGILLFLNDRNWFKASIEHELNAKVRLGSVVTNQGYSDWATNDIDPVTEVYYRLSRRGPDFLLEHSMDGNHYEQMRIFHMALLGETSVEMGKANPALPTQAEVQFGVYACSPGESSFEARFERFCKSDCLWKSHL